MRARIIVGGAVVVAAAALAYTQALRLHDRQEANEAWRKLAARAEANPAIFDPAMLEGLPEPAKRYFRWAIALGTPLKQVAMVRMSGRFGLGDREEHRFYPMEARQILAPPHGFVWVPRIGSGAMRMSGSDALLDGRAWTRFWLFASIPLVRVEGSGDVARSAAGRMLGESLWTPAALLPSRAVRWEALGPDTARAHLRLRGEDHSFDLTVAPDGRPLSLALKRWSNVNADKIYRWQPFGATYEAWGSVGGFQVPTRLKGGNHFDTPDYFPFFQAEVTDIRFL